MEDSNSQTTAPTTRSTGVRYGLFLGGISIAYFLILTIAGIDMTEGPARWASFLFYFGIIYLAHKYYKEEGDGFMSYGQGMGITFWIALVSSGISSVFSYIYMKFIDSGFVEAIKQKQIEQMQERGMSDEEIDRAMDIAGAFMTPEAMLIFGIIFGIIFIVFCGLLVSIITQKKKPEPGF